MAGACALCCVQCCCCLHNVKVEAGDGGHLGNVKQVMSCCVPRMASKFLPRARALTVFMSVCVCVYVCVFWLPLALFRTRPVPCLPRTSQACRLAFVSAHLAPIRSLPPSRSLISSPLVFILYTCSLCLFRPTLARSCWQVVDPAGTTIGRIKGECEFCYCCETSFHLFAPDDVEEKQSLGFIQKKFSGFAKELFTNADNFYIK
jgi:hypothetical protein